MTIKVGINGMGRIGRMVLRSIFESQKKNLKINHINNRSNSEITCQLKLGLMVWVGSEERLSDQYMKIIKAKFKLNI